VKRQSCADCEHAGSSLLPGISNEQTRWFCGHYDVLELDSNEPGRSIGFSPAVPWWCPLSESLRAALPWHEIEPMYQPPKSNPPKTNPAQGELF